MSNKSIEELRELVKQHHVFTADELSVDEAIELFKPFDNGSYFKTHVLMGLLPQEYMGEEKLIRYLISTRYPFSDNSVFHYATDVLKNNKDLASYAIQEHGSYAVLELMHDRWCTQEEIAELKKNPNFVFISEDEERVDEKGRYPVHYEYAIMSDRSFIEQELDKKRKGDWFASSTDSIANALLDCNLCKTQKDLYLKALNLSHSIKLPSDELLKDPEVVTAIVKNMVEKNDYYSAPLLAMKQEETLIAGKPDKRLTKLVKCASKICDLPRDAKIRKALYRKTANSYIKTLELETNPTAETSKTSSKTSSKEPRKKA